MIDMRQAGFTDGHQFAFRRDSLHKPGTRCGSEGRCSEIAALADKSYCGWVDQFRRKLGKQFRRGNEGFAQTAIISQIFQLVQCTSRLKAEWPRSRAA